MPRDAKRPSRSARTVATMAAGHGLVSAYESFSGGERPPSDPERTSFGDRSPLRVLVRHEGGPAARLIVEALGQ